MQKIDTTACRQPVGSGLLQLAAHQAGHALIGLQVLLGELQHLQLMHAVRAVFIMDTEATVRAILYSPLSNGRNMEEILRLVKAMQLSDKHKVATPANWQPGDEVIVPPPGSCGIAKDRMESQDPDVRCLDWFMCLKKCPK